MSRTESAPLELGISAPGFALPDVTTGKIITLDDFAEKKALLVMFICRHCPYVKHVQAQLALIGEDYAIKSVGILAISSNDAIAFPADAPSSLREMAAELGFAFPFCYDETQDVARAYGAACTPDFFLFDEKRQLVYHGQLDSSRRSNDIPVTGEDLRFAIDRVLNGQPVSPDQKPGIGCNIKWR
jgi:peroxiredoxin